MPTSISLIKLITLTAVFVMSLTYNHDLLFATPLNSTNQLNSFPPECYYCHDDGSELNNIFSSFVSFKDKNIRHNYCRDCHVNNYILSMEKKAPWYNPISEASLKRVRKKHSYIVTPRLQSQVMINTTLVNRYTDCGLEQFLHNPISRQPPFITSMFPLNQNRSKEVITSLSDHLESCNKYVYNPTHHLSQSDYKKVSVYFEKNCSRCHSRGSISKAPILRIGIALLSFDFFKHRVLNGVSKESSYLNKTPIKTNNKASIKMIGHSTMPNFTINNSFLLKLYRYISQDRSDLMNLQSNKITPQTNNVYFNDIVNKVFKSGCQHCHSPDPSTIKSLNLLFSINKEIPTFPYAGNAHFNKELFSQITSINSQCEKSILVQKLLDRHSEWNGLYENKKLPGPAMPINMKPLSHKLILMVDLWTKNHCPSFFGLLCENKCNTQGML